MLRFHLSYRCRDSGACCRSGWPIPVEAPLYRTLAEAMASGRLAVAAGRAPSPAFVDAELPPEYARVLAMDGHGACVFHDATHGRCVIHQALGAGAKPTSCRAFPLIGVWDPRGVSISLSHYCPSAVDLLFGSSAIEIVALSDADDRLESDALAASLPADLEGLDARDALPPRLRDDALVDWESLTLWERLVAAVLDRAASPEAAIDRLWRSVDALQSWRAADGSLAAHVARVAQAEGRVGSSPPPSRLSADHASLVSAVWSAIPAHVRPAMPLDAGVDVTASTDEIWQRESRPLCRYLAARAHACWPLHQGAHGLRSQLAYLEATLAVVRLHLTATRNPREAIRRADLWLVHLASPDRLAPALDALLPPSST
jgi:Fe-S-cluster containining protein